jgi:hypothetical protein
VKDNKPLFQCRSEYFKSVIIKDVKAVDLFKPEEALTQLTIRRRSKGEDYKTDIVNKKV